MFDFYPELYQYIVGNVIPNIDEIPRERRKLLDPIVRYLKSGGDQINLIFICTHNSRRSHMGQIWAQTAALFYGLEDIHTYSGGTEATAFNPRAVKAIQNAGFEVKAGSGENPIYTVRFSPDEKGFTAFSKEYSHAANPKRNFAAVMTCSEADVACPVVLGAKSKFPLHFIDPKGSDGTPQEEEAYEDACLLIAVEMFYIMAGAAE